MGSALRPRGLWRRDSTRAHLRIRSSDPAAMAAIRLLVRRSRCGSAFVLPAPDQEAFPRQVRPRYRRPSGRLRALTYIVLYFGLITLAPLPDRLILFPTTNRIDAGAAVRKTIPFQGGVVEIWTARSALARQRGGPDIYVLRFYGNADRADRWVAAEAEMWNRRAVEVWGMNYPGFGGSTGPDRLVRLGPAALPAVDGLQGP